MTRWAGYVLPRWRYDELQANGEDVSGVRIVVTWVYDKNDTSPRAMTVRLHERWRGTSFVRRS